MWWKKIFTFIELIKQIKNLYEKFKKEKERIKMKNKNNEDEK